MASPMFVYTSNRSLIRLLNSWIKPGPKHSHVGEGLLLNKLAAGVLMFSSSTLLRCSSPGFSCLSIFLAEKKRGQVLARKSFSPCRCCSLTVIPAQGRTSG
jgi:hypothetical protein